jgi:predicted PurR-regulated permease PerM
MTASRVVLYTLLALSVVLGVYLLYLLRDVLILIFIAILFATAIAPLVDRLRAVLGPGQAVLIIYMGIALILGVIGYLILQVLLEQTITLAQNLPGLLASLHGYANSLQVPLLRDMALSLIEEAANAAGIAQPGAADGGQPGASGAVAQGVFSITVSLFSIGFGFLAILVIAYYWITERPAILRLFVSLFPDEKRALAYSLWVQVEAKLGGWVRAELILMALIAAMAAIGYTIMGLKYALLLAVFAGLMEIVPILGPWVGSAPAVLVALTQDVRLAIVVALYAVVIQTLEGHVFVPRVVGSTIGTSPLVVIVAILVGISLMGIAGGLLAVPVASAVQVIVEALILQPHAVPGGSPTRTPGP